MGGKRNKRHKEQFPDWSSSSISNKKSNDVKRENPYGLLSDKKLVGMNTSLEKPYMRLTTFPKAIDVRPLPVLKKALAHIKVHYINNEDFDFANEQLKSKLCLVSFRIVTIVRYSPSYIRHCLIKSYPYEYVIFYYLL